MNNKVTNGDLPASPLMDNINGEPLDTLDFGRDSGCIGLTKREAFAMAAMQGMLSRATQLDPADTARWSVSYACALLNELSEIGE